MIGLQNQQFFHRVFDHRIDHIGFCRHAKGHPQEIADETQAVIGIEEGLPDRIFIGHRRQGRHLGDDPVRGDHPLLRIMNVGRVVIEGRHRAHDAAHDRHRVGVTPETPIEGRQLFMDHGVAGDVAGEFGILFRIGQIAVQQQMRDFQKARLFGQLLDGIAAIEQDTFIAIDIGDLGFARRGAGKARIEGEAAGVGVKLANINDFRANTALVHRIFRAFSVDSDHGRHGSLPFVQPARASSIRPSTSCLPSTSRTSNNPGDCAEPVTAARNG